MDVDDRVRDALPVNQPYDGLVAQAYDCWLPPDGDYDDVDLYRGAIERGDGPGARARLRQRAAAPALRRTPASTSTGVDSSADMLAICRGARRRGRARRSRCTTPTGSTFDLPRRYATIYNPAGLVHADRRRRRARTTRSRRGCGTSRPAGSCWSRWASRAPTSTRSGSGACAAARRARPTASRSWCTRRCAATSTRRCSTS